MNYQQLLHYRPTCFIHQLRMCYFANGLILSNQEDGLIMYVTHKKEEVAIAKICNDGSVQEILDEDGKTRYLIPDAAITLTVGCTRCMNLHAIKTRDIGVTSLDSILQQYHRYSFTLDKIDGQWACVPGSEEIKCNQDSKFYHLTGNLLDGHGTLKVGSWEGDRALDAIVRGITSVDLPSIDMTKLSSLEQVLDKVKLYSLFS